jgi:hypothetical protein
MSWPFVTCLEAAAKEGKKSGTSTNNWCASPRAKQLVGSQVFIVVEVGFQKIRSQFGVKQESLTPNDVVDWKQGPQLCYFFVMFMRTLCQSTGMTME